MNSAPPIRHTRHSPEAEQRSLRAIIEVLEWKISRLPFKHPAYVEAARPELEERLAERRARLAAHG